MKAAQALDRPGGRDSAVVVVFAPVPGDTRLLDTLHDAAHGPIFGSIALLVLLWLRGRAAPS